MAAAVVLCGAVLVIFFERRGVTYEFFGTRRIALSEIIYFLLMAGFVAYRFACGQLWESRKTLSVLGWSMAPLVAAAVVVWAYTDPAAYYPVRAFQFVGLMIITGLTALAIDRFSSEQALKGIFLYAILMAGMLGSHYYAIHYYHKADILPLLYGVETRALHYPFLSPGQAALFGGLILLLSAGGALSNRRCYSLYLVVPMSFLAVTHTGSRSVTWLLMAVWAFYVMAFAAIKPVFRDKLWRKAIVHLVLASVVTGAIFIVSIDFPGHNTAAFVMRRSVSLLSESLSSIVNGEADPTFRGALWKLTPEERERIFKAGDLNPGIEDISNSGEVSTSFKGKDLHNVYLNIIIYAGSPVLLLFIAFILILLAQSASMAWQYRGSDEFPVYLSLLAGVMLIAGEFYANPILHIRYIWIFFALIIVLYAKHKERAQKDASATSQPA